MTRFPYWTVYTCAPSAVSAGRRAAHDTGCGHLNVIGHKEPITDKSGHQAPACKSPDCNKRQRLNPGNIERTFTPERYIKDGQYVFYTDNTRPKREAQAHRDRLIEQRKPENIKKKAEWRKRFAENNKKNAESNEKNAESNDQNAEIKSGINPSKIPIDERILSIVKEINEEGEEE